ncbi:hypothetical protein DM860_005245 [Cuscuta australis]|uniref:DRBM domain-containing protein n=1 Tax=Cuscuta australis TaxID=267555 RepID=A0A328E2N3_9ASTE|nr:hypothetical protein DM860_005245 [Cuscuta australis]
MFKAKLQEMCQRFGMELPEYTTAKEGPAHDARFNTTVTVNGLQFHSTPNKCRTSKEAQNLAASFAFAYFSANPPDLHSSLSTSRPSPSNPAPARLPPHLTADLAALQPSPTQAANSQPVSSPQSHHRSSPPELSTDPLAGTQPAHSPLPQQTLMGGRSLPMSPAPFDAPQPHTSLLPQTPILAIHNHSSPQGISSEVTQSSTKEHASMRGMYKSKLAELCQMHAWKQPEYKTEKEGPDHMPRFSATVVVNGVSFITPNNLSRSSKEATNLAAQVAFDHFSSLKPTFSQEGPFPSKTDVLHIYKNQLQQYAQKQGITLPEYSCETEGPPHYRRFKSKVALAGKVYESPQFFRTLKEAEQAAAKVALEALSPNETQKDGGLYKILLQQLAQKLGFLRPVYRTIQCGPPHAASFMSTVQVGQETYEGQAAKNKKQAISNAAEVAYNTLINCTDLVSSKMQKASATPGMLTSMNRPSLDNICFVPTPFEHSATSALQSDLIRSSSVESSGKETDKPVVSQCNSNASVLPYDAQALPDNLSSTPSRLQHLTRLTEEFSLNTPATRNMVLVYPRGSEVVVPNNASMLPCSDNEWVALEVVRNAN